MLNYRILGAPNRHKVKIYCKYVPELMGYNTTFCVTSRQIHETSTGPYICNVNTPRLGIQSMREVTG